MEKIVFRVHIGKRVVVLQKSSKGYWELDGQRLPRYGAAKFMIPRSDLSGLALLAGRWLFAITEPVPIARPRYEFRWEGLR